jgi:hypothetical protein
VLLSGRVVPVRGADDRRPDGALQQARARDANVGKGEVSSRSIASLGAEVGAVLDRSEVPHSNYPRARAAWRSEVTGSRCWRRRHLRHDISSAGWARAHA